MVAMTVSRRSYKNRSAVAPSAASRWSKNIRVMSSSSSSSTASAPSPVDKPPFKPWPSAVISSSGNYRDEAFLERHIGGPLYENQTRLDHLPVPSLQDTCKKFLPTALPLAKSESEAASLVEACKEFPNEARELQQRLLQRREENQDSSWLQHWWNTLGYLQVRDPSVINVSYFFHFSDDGTLPLGDAQIARGASMLYASAEFRKLVCSGELPCDVIGRKKTPLCSTAYKYMFHACRVPQANEDVYKIYDPSLYSHCVVARKGRFFAVELSDAATGDPLPVEVLEESLKECVNKADEEKNSNSKNLGWLTSSNRDDWANAREELVRVGGAEMEDALEKLESGALMLCLDDEHPVSRKQCGELFLHGGVESGSNRWFDKSIQLFCTANGKAGLQGEHSMMDGMPMIGLANHVTETSYVDAKKRSRETHVADSYSQSGVVDIFEQVKLQDPIVDKLVNKAKQDFCNLVTSHDLDVQSFQGYGSNFIKSAGFSPDAYVQVAMQVATYRLFGEQVGTYEATQMRPFLHGRTETTRSVSPASHAFCETMGMRPKRDEHVESARKEKLALLREATDAHVKYIGNAAKGQGVDRHFFGLSMLVNDNEVAPSLFSHPLFIRSKRWRVSTSHLTHKNFENWGYGEVVPDGVGLSYAIKADCCVFNVTALKEQQWTDRLSHNLEEVLLEMRDLVEADKPPMSKL